MSSIRRLVHTVRGKYLKGLCFHGTFHLNACFGSRSRSSTKQAQSFSYADVHLHTLDQGCKQGQEYVCKDNITGAIDASANLYHDEEQTPGWTGAFNIR